MRLDIDVKKTLALFVTIHLLIAWVAERKEKKATQQLFFTKPAVDMKKTDKTGKQYDLVEFNHNNVRFTPGSFVIQGN